HGPVEVVQLQGVGAFDRVVGLPLVGGAVAAGLYQAVQHGEEDRPLEVELEAASVEELAEDLLASGIAPEPLEDQGAADAACGDGGELPLGVGGQEQDVLRQACAGGEQGVALPGLQGLAGT